MSFKRVKLSDVCERITDGSHFSPKTVDEGFPYITVRDIDKDNINFESCEFVTKEDFSELSKNGCSPKLNDLLFSKDGTVGKVALVSNDVDFVVLSSLAILTPKLNLINPSFLFYVLKSPDFVNTAIGKKTGVAIRRIILKNLKEISVPIPSLLIQKKIVSKLDAIFAEIDKATAVAEANAKNSEALFQSYLTEIFERGGNDWTLDTLGNYYDVRDGTHDSPKFYDDGYPLVTSKNLKNGKISFEKIKFVSEEDYISISQRSGVKKGDVLMAMIGTIGNPVVIETDAKFAIKNVALFKTNDKQSPHFLRYYLGSDYVINKMEKDAKGATQKFVGLGYLRLFPIKIPSFENQLAVVSELNLYEQQTKNILNAYKSKIKHLEALKQSILQRAFEDELVKE